MFEENLREIVNGAMLPQYNGKKVSITGLVTKVNPNGITFDMRSSDDKIVKVNLRKPHSNILEGHVEVHGTAVSGTTVICDDLTEFSPESSAEFDATSHNTMCQLLQSVPNLWKTAA
ncbi:hypothetical protein RI129_006815 [Pyrocoelia pectoralis]|uniref:Replication factor A protein 3 n=1 Tax=Pyrocoelia pectoralis TaxID=417401 RepID=A0AAN7ZGG2_9COLE